jgi:hypothetical protein
VSLVSFRVSLNSSKQFPDFLPSWIPIDIDAAAIAKKLDFTSVETSDVFGAGFTANSTRTGFIFNMPILISEIGTIQVNCYTDYDKFNCATKVDVTDVSTRSEGKS